MHTFNTTQKHSMLLPMTVTKAVDTLAAIANGNANTKRNMVNRVIVRGNLSTTNRMGEITPLSLEIVATIFGNDFACDVNRMMTDFAAAKYFNSVCERLREMKFMLSYSAQCWFLIKLPGLTPEDYFYELADMAYQDPNGVSPGKQEA